MKEINAQLNYLRISPRKVRLVTDLVRGKSVVAAKRELAFLVKKSSSPILKLLNSAIASAKQNSGLDIAQLYVKKIDVDEGPALKRFMPRAMGRAFAIKKRTSHIKIVLGEIAQKQKGTSIQNAKIKNKNDNAK